MILHRPVILFPRASLLWTITLILFTGAAPAGAQSIGFRFTPNVIAAPAVSNPSPSSIYGERRLSFDSGIDYTHMFNKSWAISAGVDMGIVDWIYYLSAPLNAFGRGTGEGMISTNSNSENYMYNGLSAQVRYSFNVGKSTLQAYAGPGIKVLSPGERAHYCRRGH